MNLVLFQIFGNINPPAALERFGSVESGGLGTFLNLILNILVVAGGLYALFNLILAGYGFLSSANDPKKIEAAWAKIWQTLLGLAFIAGAFVLAAIFGQLIFGSPDAILNPSIPTLDSGGETPFTTCGRQCVQLWGANDSPNLRSCVSACANR